MKELKRRLKIFLSLFFLLTLMGTAGFMVVEDLSLAEAFYYNIVTMSTVGYGDIHPTTQVGRMFAILIIIIGGTTFLGVVANATELLIVRRESHARKRKVNMVLGTFFSEIGYHLIDMLSGLDQNIEGLRPSLMLDMGWKHHHFTTAKKALDRHDFAIAITPDVLSNSHCFFMDKRQFLIDLIENPVLIEHERFSDVLLALFHLMDELNSRGDFTSLPQTDRNHISGDFNRAYKRLTLQWLDYLEHLKTNYPYLFSLAARQNPFNPDASTIVTH